MSLNPDDISQKLANAFQKVEESKDFLEIPALKEAEGAMKQRIHNKGTDSSGERLGIKNGNAGKYSKAYEKRKKKITGEENIYPINLQLHGDLIKGYTVGQQDGKNVLEFVDEFSRKKAGWNEETMKTEIFRLSEDEIGDVKEVWLSQFEDLLRDTFGNL